MCLFSALEIFFVFLLLICSDILILLLFLILLLLVRFLTLLERNFLGHAQNRLRPIKVGFFRLLQAIIDAIKLLKKNYGFIARNFYFFSCSISITISLFQWFFLCLNPLFFSNYSIIIFLLLSSISVFPNLAIR